jgi:tRNA wybutosine-synthesizing protein 2
MIVPTTVRSDEHEGTEAPARLSASALGIESGTVKGEISIVSLAATGASRDRVAKRGTLKDEVAAWLMSLPGSVVAEIPTSTSALLALAPKRWSVYAPMLLLPAGAFRDPAWAALLRRVGAEHRDRLWRCVLQAVWKKEGGAELTHLAVNAGIPLYRETIPAREEEGAERGDGGGEEGEKEGERQSGVGHENILRSPSGLIFLHGEFGSDAPFEIGTRVEPTPADFESAFWVSTRQNGIWQTWAPRHTMFSRGNVKEKARILGFRHLDASIWGRGANIVAVGGKEDGREEQSAREDVAVDLYAGIGYFAFSYVRLSMDRVLCWEISPWSVEGLKRGAEMNGWECKTVRGGQEIGLEEALGGEFVLAVFEESNENAVVRIGEVRRLERERGKRILGDVVHVNCGFLPTSERCWASAWEILCKERDAWLHLHENVGVHDIQRRKEEIEGRIGGWAAQERGSLKVEIEHVELVKTFAPGVWHCIFDVHVAPIPD